MVIVGHSGLSLAADSILVRLDDSGAVTVTNNYVKVVADGHRAAGWVGLGAAGDLDLTGAVHEALRTATTVEQVAAALAVRHAPVLIEAAGRWKERFGSLDGFLTLVAAERRSAELDVVEFVFYESGGTLTAGGARLTPQGPNAWCSVYGVASDVARRHTSHYALDHRIASLTSGALLSHPIKLSASLSSHEYEDVARGLVNSVLTDPPESTVPGWSQGVPVVAGPVVFVRL